MDSDSTASLGNLCQCLVTYLHDKKFLSVWHEPPVFWFMLNASSPVISRDIPFESLSLPSLHVCFRYSYMLMSSSLCLLQSKQSQLSSLSSCGGSSRSFISCVVLHKQKQKLKSSSFAAQKHSIPGVALALLRREGSSPLIFFQDSLLCSPEYWWPFSSEGHRVDTHLTCSLLFPPSNPFCNSASSMC